MVSHATPLPDKWGTFPYAFVIDRAGEPTFTRGPEYFRRLHAPNPEGSLSTRSDSKRSTVNQVRESRFLQVRTDIFPSHDFDQLFWLGTAHAW